MTKWIVVGVVVLAAAWLAEPVSAQTPVAPVQGPTIVPADTVTYVPVITRRGLFGRRQVVTYQPVFQQSTGVPVINGRGRVTTVYYPPVVQQPIIPATVTGTPTTGIQQAQAIEPAPMVAPQTGPIVVPQTGPVVMQNPTYYQVRRGLFGRLRMRAVRY